MFKSFKKGSDMCITAETCYLLLVKAFATSIRVDGIGEREREEDRERMVDR